MGLALPESGRFGVLLGGNFVVIRGNRVLWVRLYCFRRLATLEK